MSGFPTTMRYPRTMRQSGTQYANAIEHHRRYDAGGRLMAAVIAALIAAPFVLMAWRALA